MSRDGASLATPETETTTHYHFCFARNFKLADEAVSKLLYEGSKATFMEDLEFLERHFDRHLGMLSKG